LKLKRNFEETGQDRLTLGFRERGGRLPLRLFRRAMRGILSVVDLVSTWVGKVVSVLTLFVALAIVYEILMRYTFSKPTVWASESTVFACGLVYLPGRSMDAPGG
jgi:hypothetical protein